MSHEHSRFSNKPLTQPTRDSQTGTAFRPSKTSPWSVETQKFLAAAGKAEPALVNTTNTSNLASEFRHSGWAPFRKRVDEALASIPEVSERRLSAFRCCGGDAFVETRTLTSVNAGTGGINGANVEYRIRSTKCRDRFCVPCSNARASVIRKQLAIHMHGVTKGKEAGRRLSLIGLTLAQSKAPLTEILDRLTKCLRALRNKPLWKKAVQGGVSIIENKIGEDGESWHCHFHIIAEAKFINQKALSALWHEITGDSYITDVRRVGALSGAISYITKYVTKAADHSILVSPRHLQEAITAYSGRRLVSTFGTWRGLQLSEDPDEEFTSESAGDWRPIGPLDEFIRRAAAGSTEAISIMRRLTTRKREPPDDMRGLQPF